MGRRAVWKFAYCNMIVFTFIFAGITLAGAYAQYVSPDKSGILPFIALSLPFLLVGNILLALYWILRLRLWFIVPLIAIASNYQYIGRIFKWSSVPSDDEVVNVLKVATFNADSFGKEWTAVSTKDLARYLNDEGVDIICFQEFGKGSESYPRDSIYAAFKVWPYKVVPLSPPGKDCLQLAILSRYPIKDNLLMTFKDTPNCAMWCDVAVGRQNIRIFNLHLQTTSVSANMRKIKESVKHFNLLLESLYDVAHLGYDMKNYFSMRGEQADYIHAKIKECPYPVVVCGDFNSVPSSYVYRRILGDELQDGFRTAGKGYMYTFRYLKHLLRIDYIFTSRHFEPLQYYTTHRDFHSDHNPVIAAMRVR